MFEKYEIIVKVVQQNYRLGYRSVEWTEFFDFVIDLNMPLLLVWIFLIAFLQFF